MFSNNQGDSVAVEQEETTCVKTTLHITKQHY